MGFVQVTKPVNVLSGSINTSGDNTIQTIASDERIHIFHISFVIDPGAANNTVVTVKTGSTTVISWALNKNGSAFAITPANSSNHIEGASGDDLIINLNQSETVYYNILYNLEHI